MVPMIFDTSSPDASRQFRLVKICALACFAFAAGLLISSLNNANGAAAFGNPSLSVSPAVSPDRG
jgi:hypothetical protein